MRMRVLATLATLLLTAGCGQASPPLAGHAVATGAAASTVRPTVPSEVAHAIERFSKFEGRKVSVKRLPMSDGRSASELRVRLNAADKALLVQLYRLFPRPIEPEAYPAGLVERSREHLTTLYRFHFPDREPLDAGRVEAEMMTKVYRDGDGEIIAYESWMPGDDFQVAGKYDLKGRILKVDLEVWEN